MYRILLALGVKNFEAALKSRINSNKYVIVGEAIYKEAVPKAIKETSPDILIIRESLSGSKDILELLTYIRRTYHNLRIIFIASSERRPGDKLLAYVTSYGIYDILQGDILIDSLIDAIEHPKTLKDAYIFMPDAKFDSDSKEPVFQTKEIVVPEQEILNAKNKKNKKPQQKNYTGEQYYSPDIFEEDDDEIDLSFEDDESLEDDIFDLPDNTEEDDDIVDFELEEDLQDNSDDSYEIELDDNDDIEIELDDDSEIELEDEPEFDLEDEDDEFLIDDDENYEQDTEDDYEIELDESEDLEDKEDINETDEESFELDFEDDTDDNDYDLDISDEDDLSQNVKDTKSQEEDIIIDTNDEIDIDEESENFEDVLFNPYSHLEEPKPQNQHVNTKKTNLKNIKTFDNSKDILNKAIDDMGMEKDISPDLKDIERINKLNPFNKVEKSVEETVNIGVQPMPIPKPIIKQKSKDSQQDKYSRKKSPFGKRMIDKNKKIENAGGEAQNGRPENRTINKQKIISFIAPKIGVGNSHIAFSSALKIASTGAKVLFIQTSEDGATIDYLYELGDNRGLDIILKGNNNFTDDTILRNIVSIPDKKNSFFNDNSDMNLIGKKAIKYFPESFNYLIFSEKFRSDSAVKHQQYSAEKFVEMITLLLSQYNYEYIIIDADFDIDNILLPYILKYSSQIFVTITQDVEITNRYLNNLKPYLDMKIGKNVNKYILLNKEEKISFTSNKVSNLIEEPILSSLPYLGEIFTESNYQGIPVIMSKNERIQDFFDMVARVCIGK